MLDDETVREAEERVLATALVSDEALAAAQSLLRPTDFARVLHQEVFETLVAMERDGVRRDFVGLAARLEVDRLGGHAAIGRAVSIPGAPQNVTAWIGVVRAAARKRTRGKWARELEAATDEIEHEVIERGLSELGRLSGDGGWKRQVRSAADIAASQGLAVPSLLSEALLPRGHVAMVHGRGGLGKTYMLFGLGLAISRGAEWLALPTSQGRVLFVSWEVPEAAARMFIREWSAYDASEPTDDVLIATAETAGGPLLDEGSKALVAFIREHRADLVVLDPFRSSHTKDENDNSAMSGIMDGLRMAAVETGASILLSHHDRKSRPGDKGDDPDAGRGSSAIRDAVRASWRLSQAKGQLCLEFEKVSFGTAPEPIWLKRRTHRPPEVTAAPESAAKAGKANRKERLKEILRTSPDGMTVAQAADESGFTADLVKRYLAEIPEAQNLRPNGKSGLWVIDQPMGGAH